ncbi:MAG: glycosyltransferase family 2 protein [Phycisphaeraceae bacterium]
MSTLQTSKQPEPAAGDRRKRAPLTAIILTFNEAENIGPCLQSLDWIDDVVLIDSGSTDDTVALAQQARPDVRIFTNAFEDFGQQRNFALDHAEAKHDWILFLDADERSNLAFAEAIQNAIADPDGNVGFYLCYRNYFLGKWIKRCTMYPSWQLRLLKQGEVRYRKEGHGQREVTQGPLDYLHAPYDHYGFSKGITDWIARHNHYSSNEVELIQSLQTKPLVLRDLVSSDAILRRRCLKRLAARVGFRPLVRFVYLYFIRLGVLDGRAGFYFCLLRMSNDLNTTVKLVERRVGEPRVRPVGSSEELQ